MIQPDQMLRDEIYITTYSGKQFRPLAPSAEQIDIVDIAHGLAYQCRLHGQTRYFYSLAQHSLLVAGLVPAPYRLAALLHDAVAAYLGDMAKSIRYLIPEYPLIEKRIMNAVGEKFGLSNFDAVPLKRAHLIAQETELRDLWPDAVVDQEMSGKSAPIPRRIEFMSPEEARFEFSRVFEEQVGKRPAAKIGPAEAYARKSR